jgi:hypothetical protein
MFSKGQWVFASFFVVAFVIVMVYAYTRDKELHKKFYNGSYKVLVGFILFILLLFLIKIFFKH